MAKEDKKHKGLLYSILLIVIIAFFMFPVYWIFVGAFKFKGQFFHYPPVFFPTTFSLANFKAVLMQLGGMQSVMNSLIVAGLNTLIATVLAIFAGYSIGRYKWGGDNLSFFILSLLFAPPVVAVTPLFTMFRMMHLIDTYPALIWSYMLFNLPFAIWLIKSFVEDLPEEIEMAALVDGYSRFRAFRKVTLPLVLHGIVVSALFVFVFAWNEFLFALIFTRFNAVTLPVFISGLIGGHEIKWGLLSALSIIASIPSIVLVVAFQKYLIRGLTFGAVKG